MGGTELSYEQIRVTDELNRSVQQAVGVHPRPHETLGELVKGTAGAPRRQQRLLLHSGREGAGSLQAERGDLG